MTPTDKAALLAADETLRLCRDVEEGNFDRMGYLDKPHVPSWIAQKLATALKSILTTERSRGTGPTRDELAQAFADGVTSSPPGSTLLQMYADIALSLFNQPSQRTREAAMTELVRESEALGLYDHEIDNEDMHK